MNILKLQGLDGRLFDLVAPLVMNPAVLRQNNNYPFKTSEEYVWFIALREREVVGLIPVEQKNRKKAVINNYYVKAEGAEREEILSLLLPAVTAKFEPESWLLNSITLIQDKEIFEKFEFTSLDKKWTRYVKMYR